MARQLRRLGGRFGAAAPAATSSISKRVERPREVGGEAHRLGRAGPVAARPAPPAPAAAPADRPPAAPARTRRPGRARRRSARRARDRRSAISRGSTRPAAAGADERLGDRAHGAVVGQQDAPAREVQRPVAEPRDQPRDERVGERAVRRDGEDRRARGRTAAAQTFGQDLLGRADRLRVADVEPQALVDRAEAAAFGDRPVPQDVGRERPFGRVLEQRASRPSGCRCRRTARPATGRGGAAGRRGPCGNRPGPRWFIARACGTSSSSASILSPSQCDASSFNVSAGPVDPQIVAVDREERVAVDQSAAPGPARRRFRAAARARRRSSRRGRRRSLARCASSASAR